MGKQSGLWKKTRDVKSTRLGVYSAILILCFLLAACTSLVPEQEMKIQELKIDLSTQTNFKADTTTPTDSPSQTPTNTSQPTNTPKPSNTATTEPTSTPEATQTPTQTLAPTHTVTLTQAPTETPTATVTPTVTVTSTTESIGCPNGCTEEKPGCHIKGNISSKKGEKIYHMPYQRYYQQTVINPAYGERWFCTETEAIANGWRKSKQ